MAIRYDEEKKDLPCDQLHRLFSLAGWTTGEETEHMRAHFNAPFLHSTLVLSAWDGERLVGVSRALSDTIARACLYDLVVDPEYRNQGIGSELVKRCVNRYPTCEWLLETTKEIAGFYRLLGFKEYGETVMYTPSRYF